MDPLTEVLLAGLEEQADVESVSDGSYSIIGPIHIGELADYVRKNYA